ncbi:AAA family ATPase [Thermophagus xiamenensis]|uniref:ATPase AAA-type core domain-containing protein n=1 Tax=Thermophagus xiamenensis TaxID=385682 RepID=A0A1I2BHU2_9BACT|nr:ATP-binding protein [Thermophagus xiamenensis]SFE55745.1 hypothetical protein SAMN05444380_11364 [Thermophagus xiamenensis]
MIQELRVRNFLSFKDEVTFSFKASSDNTLEDYYVAKQKDGTRLLKLAMVYGANASGKSNLIEAFNFIYHFIHKAPTEGRNAGTGFMPFLFGDTAKEPGEFELVFYVDDKKHRYRLKLDREKVLQETLTYYPSTRPVKVFERYFSSYKNISVVELGPRLKASELAQEAIQLKTLKNTSVFVGYNQVNVFFSEIERVKDWFNNQYLSSICPYSELTRFTDNFIRKNPEKKDNALTFLKGADFNIDDILFEDKDEKVSENFLKLIDSAPLLEEEKTKIKNEKVIRWEKIAFRHKIEKDKEVQFYSMPEELQSRGTLRYYGLAGLFFHAIEKDAFLPIDEIGSDLHPLLVIHFIKEFLKKSSKAQLLFTTHNMSILNEKDILRKDAIWFTEKRKDGSTDLFSLSDFKFRKELSFYKAYKIGKFGAIPEL